MWIFSLFLTSVWRVQYHVYIIYIQEVPWSVRLQGHMLSYQIRYGREKLKIENEVENKNFLIISHTNNRVLGVTSTCSPDKQRYSFSTKHAYVPIAAIQLSIFRCVLPLEPNRCKNNTIVIEKRRSHLYNVQSCLIKYRNYFFLGTMRGEAYR